MQSDRTARREERRATRVSDRRSLASVAARSFAASFSMFGRSTSRTSLPLLFLLSRARCQRPCLHATVRPHVSGHACLLRQQPFLLRQTKGTEGRTVAGRRDSHVCLCMLVDHSTKRLRVWTSLCVCVCGSGSRSLLLRIKR